MPAPHHHRPPPQPDNPPPAKKARVHPPQSQLHASTPAASPPASPPSRRRAPALERLPRWLFAPVRRFVSPRNALPLPQRVAVRGKPFYDWDAWAIALLHAPLWRRRGPWERLVRSCREARPHNVDSLPDIKAALVRIVVAEVVSLLVARSGDALTPEDRNWITSVASRQKGRDPRKPTLMLLFDLAFPIFDLASYCRSRPSLPSSSSPTNSSPGIDSSTSPQASAYDRLHAIIAAYVAADAPPPSSRTASTTSHPSVTPSPASDSIPTTPNSSPSVCTYVHPIVLQVLQLIDTFPLQSSVDQSSADAVHVVVDAMERLLTELNAPRWNTSYKSHAHFCITSTNHLSRALAHRVPFSKHVNPKKPGTYSFPLWYKSVLTLQEWPIWAELGSEFSHVNIASAETQSTAKSAMARSFVVHALTDCADDIDIPADPSSFPDSELNTLSERYLGISNASKVIVHVSLIIDTALAFEEFFTQFSDTYGNPNACGPDMHWIISSFERIVRDLSVLRTALVVDGSCREEAMIVWGARMVDIAQYYRECIVTSTSGEMAEDLHRAIRIAFADASWPQVSRDLRVMTNNSGTVALTDTDKVVASTTPPQHVGDKTHEPAAVPAGHNTTSTSSSTSSVVVPRASFQLWVLALDLRDPLNLALAIAPWDPQRALALLDQAIGLTPRVLQRVRDGHEALPLWDFRRMGICRVLRIRFQNDSIRIPVALERLQPLFDEKDLHVGGTFSPNTARMLEAETAKGNFCAQTTLGLLFAGSGCFWDVARCLAKMEKSLRRGMKLLYLSSVAGDPEACTGLSHVWATDGWLIPKEPSMGEPFTFQDVVELLKLAVQSQNDKAVLNVGVLWRYGVEGVMPGSICVAVDSFLMALQGAVLSEVRCIAAQHLASCFSEDKNREVWMLLSKLSSPNTPKYACTSSPFRIDQFSGSQ